MQAIFLDIEATGLNPSCHRVIEIAFKLVDLPTGEVKLSYERIVKQPLEVWNLSDPVSLEINGFTWEKIQGGISEETVAKEIIQLFNEHHILRGTSIYICQNPAFDRTFFTQLIDIPTQERFQWPYHWLDLASMFWAHFVQSIHDKRESYPEELNLSKNAIAARYGLPIETYPHSALNGVDHLLLCYRTVIGF
jgi:oligoribonuclease